MKPFPLFLLALAFGVPTFAQGADPVRLTIHADQPGIRISPIFNGLMTEEINHAYDGGLYAELISNRAFRDDDGHPLKDWSLLPGEGTASFSRETITPIPGTAFDRCVRIDITQPSGEAGVKLANDGYWGIPVRPDTTYQVSFYARATAGVTGPLTVALESDDGATTFGTVALGPLTSGWQTYSGTLHVASATPSLTNRFVLRASGAGSVWITGVSLFPPTYHDRANGNRIDLMEKLAAMKPKFLRFPGGNYLDPGHYPWKQTIGPVDARAGHPGAWNYRSSDGLGLLEFLDWCEDLKMGMVLAVSDGRGWLPAHADITPLVHDALDEIEYVTGDSKTTKWGAKRAADGHPEPFSLSYVEIGNEDFFDKLEVYNARFAAFYDAIKAKYPNIQIIATRDDLTSRRPDLIDDHYYRSAYASASDAHHYDAYNRAGPKVFVGEWASTEGSPTPTLQAALGDAAWLTGLEHDSDVVVMEAYAPLLVNVNAGAAQWGTNLIGYNALDSFGSPSYWMQVMFANYTGDRVLPVDVVRSGRAAYIPQGAAGVGTWETQAEFADVYLARPDGTSLLAPTATGLPFRTVGGSWTARDEKWAQVNTDRPALALIGDAKATDYILTLRARKTGGSEGFLIPFHVQDEKNLLWWNVGGWHDTHTNLEKTVDGRKGEIGNSSPFTVKTGRWYSLKIELRGNRIRTFIDGRLMNVAMDLPPSSLYTAASRDSASGDVLLKVVNFSPQPQLLQIDLKGATNIPATAGGQVLSGQPGDVNSIAQPEKVSPQPIELNATGSGYSQELPANSVTVVRFKAR